MRTKVRRGAARRTHQNFYFCIGWERNWRNFNHFHSSTLRSHATNTHFFFGDKKPKTRDFDIERAQKGSLVRRKSLGRGERSRKRGGCEPVGDHRTLIIKQLTVSQSSRIAEEVKQWRKKWKKEKIRSHISLHSFLLFILFRYIDRPQTRHQQSVCVYWLRLWLPTQFDSLHCWLLPPKTYKLQHRSLLCCFLRYEKNQK